MEVCGIKRTRIRKRGLTDGGTMVHFKLWGSTLIAGGFGASTEEERGDKAWRDEEKLWGSDEGLATCRPR